jgi:hypothetical protein
MAQSNAQRAGNDDAAQPGNHPVAKFRHGGIELTVWRNQTQKGTAYNTITPNSYRDERSGEGKNTDSFSATDLLVVGELARQAFAEITIY